MVEQKKFEQTFINEYMAWNLHDTNVEQRGMAKQKAEDEKLIAQITAQKDAENARLNERIAQLEAMLAKK